MCAGRRNETRPGWPRRGSPIRGARGIFYDYGALLKELKASYGEDADVSESAIMRPVLEAEILVLDELGSGKTTEWVWETVAHVLNTRYNERRPTILTSNYVLAPPLLARLDGPKASLHEPTLGDRIGARMFSRLHEMCGVIDMQGEDFRVAVKGPSSRFD